VASVFFKALSFLIVQKSPLLKTFLCWLRFHREVPLNHSDPCVGLQSGSKAVAVLVHYYVPMALRYAS